MIVFLSLALPPIALVSIGWTVALIAATPLQTRGVDVKSLTGPSTHTHA